MKKCLVAMSLLLGLNACGPSTADMAKAEQNAKAELLKQQKHAEEQEELKNQLINLKSELAGAETKLQGIEEFQFLRTNEEKAQQVADQTQVIEGLKLEITKVQDQIDP